MLIEKKYNSTSDILRHIEENGKVNGASRGHYSERFCRYSWDDTLTAFRDGWQESESVKINADTINLQIENTSTTVSYDVTGHFLDVGAFLSGIPECWGQMIEESKPMQQIKLMVDVSVPGSINAQTIEMRGGAIIALIDTLKNKGFYCDITVKTSAGGVSGLDDFCITLNLDSNNGYSRDMLAFCIAHPGFERRIGFAVAEIEFNSSDLGGYGRAIASDSKGFDIVFPPIHQDQMKWETAEQATENIYKIIQKLERR